MRDTVGEGSGEMETPGERLVDAVALGEREAPGERLVVTVAGGDAEARGEAVLSALVPVPTGVTEPEREEDALPRPLLLCEGLPLSLPRVGVGVPEGEPRTLTVPLSVRVDEGDGGGARVKVTTMLKVGAREAEGASLAEAADAEGDAVRCEAVACAEALPEKLPRDADGEPEGAGVPDTLPLTLGELLARSLAVAALAEGEPLGRGEPVTTPVALPPGVSDWEPEGVPVGASEGDSPPEALADALIAAEALEVGQGGALIEGAPLPLPLGVASGEKLPSGLPLLRGEPDEEPVGAGVLEAAGEPLGDPVRDVVEDAELEELTVAETAALRETSVEPDAEGDAAPEVEGSGDAEGEAERGAVTVPLRAAVPVARGEVETLREGGGVPETGAEGEASGDALAAGLPLGAPLADAAAVGVTGGDRVTDAVTEAAPEAEATDAEAQIVKVSVGYDGKGVEDTDTECEEDSTAEGVRLLGGETEGEALGGAEADAPGDPEALPDAREEGEARVDTVADGDEVSDADAHAEGGEERDARADFEGAGERLAGVDTEGDPDGAAEREGEAEGRAEVVALATLPVGMAERRAEALTDALTEGEPVTLALVQGRALAELDKEGDREGGADTDAAPERVPVLLPLATRVPLGERVAPPDAVPFTTDTVALLVDEPESDAEGERSDEGVTLPVAELLPPFREGEEFPDVLPLKVARAEGERAPVDVGAALPLRDTEGDADTLLVREGAPLNDALAVEEMDADGLREESWVAEKRVEAVAPEAVAAVEGVAHAVPDTVKRSDAEGLPETEGLPDVATEAELAAV